MRYLVPRNAEARGWRFIVETITDLVQWITVAILEVGAYPNGAGFEGEIAGQSPILVFGPDPADPDSARRFYRVRTERIAE